MSNKIDHALFSAHEHALEHEPCPECGQAHGGELKLKHGKHGAFLACHRYPECEYLRPLHHNDGHIVKSLGVECPECGHELVLRQGRYGMFIGCSDYPNCQHIESPNASPAPSESSQVSCPECQQGQLVERKSRYGKRFYACDRYPSCKFAVNFPPVIGICQECGYPLLVQKKPDDEHSLFCANRKCQHQQR